MKVKLAHVARWIRGGLGGEEIADNLKGEIAEPSLEKLASYLRGIG